MQVLQKGQGAVIQCRDEGLLRGDVIWQKIGGGALPKSAWQDRGRLEIAEVWREEEGEYECVAVGHEQEYGGSEIAEIRLEQP